MTNFADPFTLMHDVYYVECVHEYINATTRKKAFELAGGDHVWSIGVGYA